ncbi:aconitase/3-isopropylmalate dehydratase large subunit family protein [Acetonema longum]|uniref:3-isopropylmalate dehydratase large subunit n=1 Tax=Acetonema longum DSM 6540 TaxID=1009370 RepID=F7NFD7_9FIRM|nr:aconitase/3-isopropylmalate dehydratase large subunit family protein [Acetonema longum]EGO65262.1 3-isopropylmalate dehydratase large subunit [Acetonema longum DSM 6540]
MGQTIVQKILSCKSNCKDPAVGQIVDVAVDLAIIHDNNGPIMIKQFADIPNAKVWDPDKVWFSLDHHSPATSFRAAEHYQDIKRFAAQYGTNIFPLGRGIMHPVVAEEGLARPGNVVVGTDSHTVGLGSLGCFATGIGSTEMAAVLASGKIWLQVPETVKITLTGTLRPGVTAKDISLFILSQFGPHGLNYMAVELGGPVMKALSVEERMAIAIMGLEMGTKNVFVSCDAKTFGKIGGQRDGDQLWQPDADAIYAAEKSYDVSELQPFVARPSLPTNGAEVAEVSGTPIHQATLGSCSGAFYHDLVQAAQILDGKKVHKDVRFIIVPNTSRVVEQAARDGIIERLVKAGAIINSPTCGTCAGYEVGCLAPGDVCISTTTRNMDGRMGPGGQIYLASALTVAASAVAGAITDPREMLGGK